MSGAITPEDLANTIRHLHRIGLPESMHTRVETMLNAEFKKVSAGKIEDGGPTFPSPGTYEGMSLRDQFAGKAIQGLLSGSWTWRDLDYKPVDGKSVMENNGLCAYAQADAMLAARGDA